MRTLLSLLFGLTCLACAAASKPNENASGWPELPSGTRAVVLVTGADVGFWKPQGCNQGAGGAQYRPALDRWLATRYTGLQRVWLSTGNTVDIGDGSTVSPESMLRRLRDLPYRAIAVGARELGQLSLERLVALQRDEGVPLLASNIFDRDAMAPLFPAEVTLELAGRRWVVLALAPDRRDWQSTLAGHGTILTVDPAEAIIARIEAAEVAGEHVLLLSNLPQGELDRVLRRVDGLDLVCATDGATSFTSVQDTHGTPTVWLGISGLLLGRVAIGEDGNVLAVDVVTVRKPFPVDPAIDGSEG